MNKTAQQLDDGLVLRAGAAADVEQIVALEIAAFGDQDEPGVRGYLSGPGCTPADWAVVRDADRVVAASVLLPFVLQVDGVAVPVGQIEYVATDPAYQRRGLVRAQFDWHHRLSAAAGQVAQFVGGIPFFYRKFGYGYGVSYPDLFLFDRTALRPDRGVEIRPAAQSDIADLLAFDRARPSDAIHVLRDETSWRLWISMTEFARTAAATAGREDLGFERLFVARRSGAICGWSSLTISPEEQRVFFAPTFTTDAGVTDALLEHALDQAGPDLLVVAHDNADTIHGARVREVGAQVPYGLGLYVRIPDPVAFLEALRPVLSARLQASDRFASATGSVDLSLYDSGVAIDYSAGALTRIRSIPGVEDPFDSVGCGVAPDWFPALVLGRWGARELEDRIDDVTLGRHAAILEVLFPKRNADLVADF